MRKTIALVSLLAGALLLAAPAWAAGPPKELVKRKLRAGYPVCESKEALRQAIALGRAGTGGGLERITTDKGPCRRMNGATLWVDKGELWGWWIRAWPYAPWTPGLTTYYVQPEGLEQTEPDPVSVKEEMHEDFRRAFD